MNQAMLQARAKTAAVAGSGRAPCVPALPMRPVRVHRAVSQQRCALGGDCCHLCSARDVVKAGLHTSEQA